MNIKIKIIIIIAIFLVIVLLTVLVLVPNLTASIKNNASIEREKEENKALMENLNNLILVRDEYHLMNAEYQKYSLQLPTGGDNSIFTNEIYDIASYSDVDIYSINYSEKTVSEEEEKMGLVITEADLIIDGSYYDILNFINTVEKIPRIAKVNKIIIQSTGSEYEYLSANIRIELYYKK